MTAAEKEIHYQITMSIAADMLDKGLITSDDYSKFEAKMRGKYSPAFSDIYWDRPSK